MNDISEVIAKYGLPVITAGITIIGSTIMIKYIWTWVNVITNPVISDSNTQLIKTLNDRIHMLDNNLTLLQHKVNTILSMYEEIDDQSVIDENKE